MTSREMAVVARFAKSDEGLGFEVAELGFRA